jgi:hypothetical protein
MLYQTTRRTSEVFPKAAIRFWSAAWKIRKTKSLTSIPMEGHHSVKLGCGDQRRRHVNSYSGMNAFGEEQAKRSRVDGQDNDLVVCCGTSPGNALGGISGTCLQQLQLSHVGP